MTHSLLACGPYFDAAGMVSSLVIFLLLKPLAYFAFVRAFRYRVSRDIPMTGRQAAKLAALRALVGIVLIGGGAWVLSEARILPSGLIGWLYLYVARVVAWLWIGRSGASLRGRRLIAWTCFGTLVNAAFDVAVVVGLMTGWAYPALIVIVIGLFLYVLEVRGRRVSLRNRFSDAPFCGVCEYNLTGNLSGVCPECGTVVPT